jgi:hypothetical protein
LSAGSVAAPNGWCGALPSGEIWPIADGPFSARVERKLTVTGENMALTATLPEGGQGKVRSANYRGIFTITVTRWRCGTANRAVRLTPS